MASLYGIEIGTKLAAAGLIPENVRRIVIDIPANDPIMVYYECYGDAKLVNLTIEELIKNKDRLKIVEVKGNG